MKSLLKVLFVFIAVGICGCAEDCRNFLRNYDPIRPTPVVTGPYLDWQRPHPYMVYRRSYTERKAQLAEQVYYKACQIAQQAGWEQAEWEDGLRRAYIDFKNNLPCGKNLPETSKGQEAYFLMWSDFEKIKMEKDRPR